MNGTIVENKSSETEDQQDLFTWQRKLMLWTILMPSLLIIVFITIATFQLNRFNSQITTKNESELDNIINPVSLIDTSLSTDLRLSYIKWYSLTKMEEIAMNKRYNQGGLLVMSRVLTKYLGFFTGMILATIGAVFIISKLREDVSKLSVSFNDHAKAALASSSPGIVFGCLGTILMVSSILQHSEINVKDMPMYLNQGTFMATGSSEIPQPLGNSRDELINGLPADIDRSAIEKKRLADSAASDFKP